MSDFYIMLPVLSKNYVFVNAPPEIQKGCMSSQFQYLDKKTRTINVSLDGGAEFPDFLIADHYAPYISDRLKRVFDRMGIDNLFYQKTIFSLSEFDIEATYWLAVPPRINCLDPEYVNEILGMATAFRILTEKTGNYKIFKLSDVGNSEIFVTKEVKEEVEALINRGDLEGIRFQKI